MLYSRRRFLGQTCVNHNFLPKMKHFDVIIITFTLIQSGSGYLLPSDSQEDPGAFDYEDFVNTKDTLDAENDTRKPVYKLEDAPKLFEKFINDYGKKYKDNKDRAMHYRTFVQTLRHLNKLDREMEFSSPVEINIFADLTPDERYLYLGMLVT